MTTDRIDSQFNNPDKILIAAKKGDHTTVELLLRAGADKESVWDGGITPLWIAAHNGHHTTVELLLKAGANKEAAWRDGATPLWIASYHGHAAVIELLLKAGANKEVTHSEHGATPLYVATYKGHYTAVELLLTHGANKKAALKDGATPLYISKTLGYREISLLLNSSDFLFRIGVLEEKIEKLRAQLSLFNARDIKADEASSPSTLKPQPSFFQLPEAIPELDLKRRRAKTL